ncbi:NAD(P)H-quinone oxidoreductase subunit 5, chloroplastic [Rhizoctonia solani]|uniref:NAD(P)H-quinone oxidoreductase subunit 5, chloroplastic n=1 Tax=Rhizoctonia solani TaxID=456999 RepID=A0A0K6G1S7_9AGAM|nr:NAD(P)H-quinone oxidoreductase subunit 5, chloroplastic [Rhizoctonia solani]
MNLITPISRGLPTFKDLPLKPEYPPHAAWGVWGEKDELGTVNNITPETITAASKEIKLGLSIPLNWSMGQPKYPFYDRKGFHRENIAKTPRTVNDDIIHFNTQCSSQWDSLRHFGYQTEKVFYNGLKQESLLVDPSITTNGIHNWAKTGIVGRGVLLDFYAYAQRHNIEYSAFSQYGVTLDRLKAVQAEQGIEFRTGDILLIRFGFIAQYEALSDQRKREIAKVPHTWAGVGQSKDFLEWFWDNHFAALAGDSPAFETNPPLADFLHPVILSGFGCPLGQFRASLSNLSVRNSQPYLYHARLSSGGVFLFPLYVPWLKQHYSLTQSELSTIILAGMMGQYAFAVLWGALIDSIGPHACSLAASALFLISWSAFAYLAVNSLGSPAILAALFFTAGVGRVASYFSAIFASRSQKKSGLSTSVPLALSGLSPLVLSYVAGLEVFQTTGGVFNVPKFVFWMGIGCTVIHAIGAFGLKHVDDLANEEGERVRLMGASEDEQVIEAQREAMKAGCMVVQKVEPDGSVLVLLKDCGFWGYVAIGIVITGTAETVIANIGTIVMELPGHTETLTAAQVRLISIASTLAKLCTGPLADWICPPIDEGPTMICWCEPVRPQPEKGLNRMLFPVMCLTILASVYAYTAMYTTSADQLWVLSIGTGLAYGASWAVLPSITSVIWGARNLGRNFGILSYAPLIGTPIFTVSSVMVALLWCSVLWRRWSGRL